MHVPASESQACTSCCSCIHNGGQQHRCGSKGTSCETAAEGTPRRAESHPAKPRWWSGVAGGQGSQQECCRPLPMLARPKAACCAAADTVACCTSTRHGARCPALMHAFQRGWCVLPPQYSSTATAGNMSKVRKAAQFVALNPARRLVRVTLLLLHRRI